MTKKQKTGVLFVALLAVIACTVSLLLPKSVKIKADLSELSQQGTENALAGWGQGGQATVRYNSPNSQWWLEQWLGRGGLSAPVTASDAGKAAGVVTVDETVKRIDIVCIGQGNVKLNLTGFQSTPLGSLSKVKVIVESVRNAGELGAVYNTTLRESYAAGTEKDTFNIHLGEIQPEDIYHIAITPTGTADIENYENKRLPQRYEAEDARHTGNPSVISPENGKTGYVTGITGDAALTFRIKAEETGSYKLNIIYASGSVDDNGAFQYASQLLLLDGEQLAKMNYPSTGADTLFASNSITLELEQGTHDVTLKQSSGGAAIDCIDVTMLNSMQEEEPTQIYQGMADAENTSASNAAYFLPVPAAGYYDLTFYTAVAVEETTVCSIDGTESSVLKLDTKGEAETRVYMRKGINSVQLPHKENNLTTGLTAVSADVSEEESPALPVSGAGFTGGAVAQTADNPAKTECTGGLSTRDDSVSYTVTAPSAGAYKLSFSYAVTAPGSNAVLGIAANGQEQQAACENTFSDTMFRRQTLTIELAEGENTVTLYGIGESRDAPAIRVADVQVFLKSLAQAEE